MDVAMVEKRMMIGGKKKALRVENCFVVKSRSTCSSRKWTNRKRRKLRL